MAFDLEGARAAGYSDDEIAGFLAEQKGFNLSAARDAGYSTGEIINFLDAGKPKQGIIDRALDVAKTAATSVIGGIKEDLGIGKKSSVMDDYQGPDPRQEQGPSDLAPLSKAGYQKARDFVRNAPADKVEQVAKGDGLVARAVKKAATDTSQDPGAIAEKVFRDAANEKEVAAAERQAKFKASPILERVQQMAASLLQGDIAIADSVVGTIGAAQGAPQPIPVVVFQNLVRSLSPSVDEGFQKARAWRDNVSGEMFDAYLKASESANSAIQATKSDRAKFGEKKQFFTDAAAWDQLAKDGVSNVPANVAGLIKSGELFGDKWKDGWAVTSDTMKSMPLSLLAMYPVFGSARAAYTTALAEGTKNGLAKEAAEAMAKKAAASTAARMGALSEGVSGAGSQYSSTYQKVMGMDDAQLQKDPNFQKILAQTPAGMDQAERVKLAKRMAAGGAAQTAAVIAGVADAAGAFLGDRYIGGAFADAQQASGIIGKARAMAKGSAAGMAEEMPTEGFQSAGEQLGENLGVRQYANANQSLTADMGEQAASGAASGGMMGGVMGGAAAMPNTAKSPQQLRSEAIGQEMQAAADAFQPAPVSDATIRANMDPNGQNLVRVPEIQAPARPSLADMNQAQTVGQMAEIANAIANDNDLTSIIQDAMSAAPTQPSAAAAIDQQIQQAGAAAAAKASQIPAEIESHAELKDQALQQLQAQPAVQNSPAPSATNPQEAPQDVIARQQFLPGHGQIQAIAPDAITSQPGSIAPEQARALSVLGSVLGKQVVFFSQTGATQRLDGFAPRDSKDTVFVNVAASPDAAWANVTGHEFFHQMPADIRLGFMQAVQNVIPDHQFQQLQKYINQPNLAPLGQWEEIAADLFGNRFSEPEFWGRVFQNVGDRTMAQKILAFVQQFINKITQAFQGQKQFDTDRFVPNLEAVREAAATAMQTYLQQGNGSELIGGKKVSELSLQTLRNLAKQEGPAAQKALAELDRAGREAEQKQITIEQLFAQRAQQLEQSKSADYDKIQDAARTEKVEQAEAVTRAQGFDEKTPTALELALRQAEERAGKPVQTRNADAIVAEAAKMKDAAKQTSERLRQDKPAKKEKVETPEQKAAREKREAQRQEKIDALKPLSIKELRKIAKDKRQALYLREAAASLAAERQAEINAKLSDAGKKRKALTEAVDPERDTMASAIVKLGGISRDSVQGRLRLTPEELAIKAPGANNLARHLFHQYGRTMDSMGEALAELGYVERDENGKYDQRDFEDKLAEVAGGAELYTDVGMIRMAEEQRAAEMEALGIESPAEFAELDDLAAEVAEFTPEIEAAFHAEDTDSDIPFDLEDPRLQAGTNLNDEDIDALFGQPAPQESGRSNEEDSGRQARAGDETGSDALAKQRQEEIDRGVARFRERREAGFPMEPGEKPMGWYGDANEPLKFVSGMTAPGDFTRLFAGNKNVGIAIQELSNASIPKIAKAMAASDGSYLFVDSGAFSVFKANQKAKQSGQLGFDDLVEDFPEGGKGLNFDEILDKYHGLESAIAKADDSGYSSARIFFVMPDVVGNQIASLDLVSYYQDEINDRGMSAIVPLQSGALSLTQAYEVMMENLDLDPDSDLSPIIGIPSAVEAASNDELTELLDNHGNRITAVHILGAVSDTELQPRLDAIKESGYDGNVSADANQLRSMLYGKTSRAEAMRRLTGDISVEEAKEPTDQFELLPQSRADLEEKDARANDQDIANKDLADSQRDAFRLDAPAGTVEGEAKAMSNSRQTNMFSGERNLIITHNLSAAKLLHADRMGGLPVPSLAVIKKNMPVTGFGEITLLGSRNMADPKGYAGTKVFGADIYSPRYPSISYQFTPNMRKRFEAQFREGMEATGNKYIDWSEVESNGARELEHQAGVMWTFLKQNGIEPKIIRTEPKPLPDLLQKYADDKRMAYELESDPDFIRDAYQEQEDILTKAYGGEEFRKDAQAEIEQWKENAKRRGVAHAIRSFANQVEQYRRDKQSAGKIDERATKYQLEQQLRDAGLMDDFEGYAKEQFENIGPNERIFQGYTNTGNRKYIPHTLENVVKILKKELRGGENFSYGLGSVRAMYTPQFKTIKQIQQEKDRLVSKEQFEKVKAEINEEFLAIENQLRSYHPASDRLGFGDSVTMMMQDAAKMGIPRALEENGFEEVDPDVMAEIRDFLEKLRHMPTEYFEAKILRDVSLAEFAGAVIPDNASDAVRKVLAKNGLEVEEYKKGDEAARAAAINALSDRMDIAKDGTIKFSTGRTPMLDLNAPLAEQSPEVRRALRHEINRLRAEAWNAGKQFAGDPERADEAITGQQLLDKIADRLDSLADAAEYLQSLGVKFSGGRGPIYFSQLEKAIGDVPAKVDNTSAANWKAWLINNAPKLGVKQDEIRWTGITDYLDMLGKQKVSREQLQAFLADNGIAINEVEKGKGKPQRLTVRENNGAWDIVDPDGRVLDTIEDRETAEADAEEMSLERYGVSDTKYGNYVLPGGEDYRELLLTLPFKDNAPTFEQWNENREFLDMPAGTRAEYEEEVGFYKKRGAYSDKSKIYRSSHWDESNIIAHVRFNSRNDTAGAKVLFIEELQSDWGQEGKKKGFKSTPKAEELDAAKKEMMELNHRDSFGSVPLTQAERARLDELIAQTRAGTLGNIPAAPFVTDTAAWLSLGIKRMIRYAAENGFDKIAFVNGQQSADRYDLSKTISRIKVKYQRAEHGEVSLDAYDMDGTRVIAKDRIQLTDLDDYIGKEMADRARQQMIDYGHADLKGVDLKVGGEGMKAFYDKIVPQTVNDVLKKLGGGKIGSVDLVRNKQAPQNRIEYSNGRWEVLYADGFSYGAYRDKADAEAALEKVNKISPEPATIPEPMGTQPGFEITPELREKALAGMPLFSTQRRQIDTPEFKAWFGDSKVVDESGQPLRVYHGTTYGDITEFRPDGGRDGDWQKALDHFKRAQEKNERYGYINFRSGTFFSPHPEYAGNYTRENTGVMYPVYIKAENPIYFDQVTGKATGINPNKTPDALILHENGKINEIAVIDPTQIKSATGNNGQFDPSNPDIRFSGWRDRIIDRMDQTFNGLSGLPEMKEYLKGRNLAMGKIGRVDEMVKKIRDAFADADTTGRQQIYQYLTTRGAAATMIADQQLRTKAISIKQVINHVGQQLVARGLLDAQTQAQNADAYLPRLYLKHVLSEGDWKALGGGKKPSDMGYLKKRKNIDPVVRELILGEIKDPTFLSASAIAKPLRDIALLDWLAQIAQNPAWIYPNQMIQYNGQMVTSYWLKAEADRIEKQAAHYQAAQKTAAIAIAQNMRSAANQAMANASNQDTDPENYKRIPDTQRYGVLRGLLVNKAIYDDIIGQAGFMDPDPNWFRQVFFAGGVGTRLTQFWKFTKVAANPPGQIRNFISNLVMLNLSGVPMHVLPIRMVQALHDIVKHGPVYQAALTHGLTEGTFTTQELGHIKRDLLALEAQAQKLNPLVWMKIAGAWLYENLGKAYQFAETWTKIAKMLHEMKGGMSADDAAIEANKWLFDYSLVPGWVRDARSSPVGMPFITYQMKVLPRLAEVALKAPWRLLPYLAMVQGMAYYAATSFGSDDPDKKEYLLPKWLRDLLGMKPLELDAVMEAAPKWMKDKGNVVMLPTRDDNGNLVLMDVSYFFPWSYWTAAASQPFSDEPVKNTISAFTQNFSAPVIGTISALMLNKDGFTQREIYKPNDPDDVKRLAVFNYLYNNLVAPPVLTDNGLISPIGIFDPAYGGRLMQAVHGNTNRFGDPRSTMNQALLRGVGINEYPIDPDHTRATNIQTMKRQLQDAQTTLKQKLKDQGLTEEQRERLRTEYVDHIQKQAEELQKYAERSNVPRAFTKP